MSDLDISGANRTNNNAGMDAAERHHREDMEQARALVAQLSGRKPTTDADTRAAVQRFQLSERSLRDSPTGVLDAPTKELLEKRIREKADVLTEVVDLGMETGSAIRSAITSGAARLRETAHGAEAAMKEAGRIHVHKLSVGDAFELTGSVKLSAGGVDSEEKGKLTITREAEGTYTLEASGDYGLKGAGMVGAGAGTGLRLATSSEAEAMRLADILCRGALAASAPLGVVLAASRDDAAADVAFVREHVIAISLSGEAAAKVKGALGGRQDGAGAFVTGGLSGALTERVTLEMDHGAIKGLVCEASCKVKGAVRAGADLQPSGTVKPGAPGDKLTAGSRDLGLDFDGTQTSTVTIRTHMDLPGTLTAEQRAMDPGALFASMQSQVLATARVDVALQVEGAVSRNLLWNQEGGSGKLSLALEGVKADSSTSIASALSRGDVDGALAAGRVSAQRATLKAEVFAEHGDMHSGSLGGDKSAELGVELQIMDRQRVYVSSPVMGTPAEVVRSLGQGLHVRAPSPADVGYAILC